MRALLVAMDTYCVAASVTIVRTNASSAGVSRLRMLALLIAKVVTSAISAATLGTVGAT